MAAFGRESKGPTSKTDELDASSSGTEKYPIIKK
jgi:hypothetical protein